MKPSDHRELWDDALADSLPAGFADEALATMLGSARKRRRQRAAMKGATVLALILTALFFALHPAPNASVKTGSVTVQQLPDPPPPAAEPEAPPQAPLQLQVLSDEELLAQFPGRAVAIIGSGDSKQLVFLDQ